MFDKAEQRSSELENSYDLLDKWKSRGDELLYSMMPKSVADRLQTGSSPLSTCEVNKKCCKENPFLSSKSLSIAVSRFQFSFVSVFRCCHDNVLRISRIQFCNCTRLYGCCYLDERGFFLL